MKKKFYSFKQWCKDNNHKDWLDLWDYDLNNISPDKISYGTHTKYYFKCQRKIHESKLNSIHDLTNNNNVLFCKKCRSFGQYLLDTFGENGVDMYWSNKNSTGPFAISKKSNTKILIKCVIDISHPDYFITPAHFVEGKRCPVCSGRDVLIGINDVLTTRPDVAKLLLNANDGFKYTFSSSKKIYFKCPRCGNIIYTSFNSVSYSGLSCSKCNDGISYPNKFVYNFIDQLSILYSKRNKKLQFKPEKIFEWSMNYQHKNKKLSGDKRYDMYIDDYNIIIENNGDYHYKNGFKSMKNARTFDEVIENDAIKKNLALSNGIQESHYVVLDCAESNMEHIKMSIMSSCLPQLLDFVESDIDWNKCDEFATSSRVYEACTLWNSGIKNRTKIASLMKLGKTTVGRYIKRCQELGILDI